MAGCESSVEVQRATAVLVCIISWGMPRSGDRRASCALHWSPPCVILEFILRRSSECDGNVRESPTHLFFPVHLHLFI